MTDDRMPPEELYRLVLNAISAASRTNGHDELGLAVEERLGDLTPSELVRACKVLVKLAVDDIPKATMPPQQRGMRRVRIGYWADMSLLDMELEAP